MGRSGKSLYDWCIENEKQELLSEWDYAKNEGLTPKDISFGSVKKVWWVCPKGHSYDSKPNGRTRNGSGCPYCAHQKIKTGYNDLQTVYPEVAQYWDSEKNGMTPDKVIAGSHKKVWWKCEKGHSWESTINSKIEGHHCPYCSGRFVIKGETDLETLFPELVKEWNYEKNDMLPSEVSTSSSRKVWWKCKKCGTEWKALISNRTRDDGDTGSGCPQCTKELSVSFPEKVLYHYIHSVFEDSLENIGNDYFSWLGKMSIDIFVPSLRIGIEYDGGWHTKEKDLRKNKLCLNHDVSLIRIRDNRLSLLNDTSIDFYVENRNEDDLKQAVEFVFQVISDKKGTQIKCDIDIGRDRGLIYTSMNLQQKENSLSSVNPELEKQWNYEKNAGLRPDVVTANSHKKIWWICEHGHEWSATVASRNAGGNGCPICAGKTPQKRHNSIDIENPELLVYWDYDKNEINPSEITIGSRKKVFWKCPTCNHSWETRILDMKGCPRCTYASKIQQRENLELKSLSVSEIKELDISIPPLVIQAFSSNKYERTVSEWDTLKNGGPLTATTVVDVYKNYWWKCKDCGYEWESPIEKRIGRAHGCPACKGKAVHTGFNDLATTRPDLLVEWHPTKNAGISPDSITKGSAKKVWWLCSTCGHEWETAVKNRSHRGSGCPECGKKKCVESRRKNKKND